MSREKDHHEQIVIPGHFENRPFHKTVIHRKTELPQQHGQKAGQVG